MNGNHIPWWSPIHNVCLTLNDSTPCFFQWGLIVKFQRDCHDADRGGDINTFYNDVREPICKERN